MTDTITGRAAVRAQRRGYGIEKPERSRSQRLTVKERDRAAKDLARQPGREARRVAAAAAAATVEAAPPAEQPSPWASLMELSTP